VARGRLIRASEIGEYVYCRRAWWLGRVVGLEPAGRERRERGTALHARHGRSLQLSNILLIAGLLLLVIAVSLLIIP
jgi:CRISPR/Cas system-associated exonuclease Cas4 (RecB family)